MGSTNGSLSGGAIEREAKKKSRTPVEIADDTWLETLRSLSFRQWSKVRIVSRQLNGVAQRNVSTLPCAIIDSATTRLVGGVTADGEPVLWSKGDSKGECRARSARPCPWNMERNNILSNIIVLDSTIPATDAIQWFKDRGIALDIPKDIQPNNAFIGINLEENRCVDITVLGSAQQKKLSLQDQGFQKEVVFYAEFRPKQNENSWASMAHFLKLLYHPVTYVKKFRTVVSLPSTFPAIVLSGYLTLDAGNSLKAPISGTDVIEERNDDSGGIVYVVSNGQNRMRVEFSRKYPNDDRGFLTVRPCRGPGAGKYVFRQYNIRVEVSNAV
ncbi:hypothetical protein Ddc_12308 [Ditylenchus destructor]|nr:hypothetical protein Ddc_12308 [Ditylenchus destructor]